MIHKIIPGCNKQRISSYSSLLDICDQFVYRAKIFCYPWVCLSYSFLWRSYSFLCPFSRRLLCAVGDVKLGSARDDGDGNGKVFSELWFFLFFPWPISTHLPAFLLWLRGYGTSYITVLTLNVHAINGAKSEPGPLHRAQGTWQGSRFLSSPSEATNYIWTFRADLPQPTPRLSHLPATTTLPADSRMPCNGLDASEVHTFNYNVGEGQGRHKWEILLVNLRTLGSYGYYICNTRLLCESTWRKSL